MKKQVNWQPYAWAGKKLTSDKTEKTGATNKSLLKFTKSECGAGLDSNFAVITDNHNEGIKYGDSTC